MKILFLYNGASFEEKVQNLALGECASGVTVGAVYEALNFTGSEVIPLNLFSPQQLEEAIAIHNVDIAFVIAEGFLDMPHTLYDGSGAMMVREILGRYGIPSTHSSPEAMKLCRNKDCTYHTLSAFGINVPSFGVIGPDKDLDLTARVKQLKKHVAYPLFVKPVGGGSSICIDRHSVVHDRRELLERIKMVHSMLDSQPVLVETYLPGREYTVCVLGNGEKNVLPVIGFPPDAGVRSAADKGAYRYVSTEVELLTELNPVGVSLMSLGAKTFDVLGVQDIIRIDVKEDSQGVCHVIDVNGTPSLAPSSSVITMAGAAGIEYCEMVALVLFTALLRKNLSIPVQLMNIVSEPLGKLRLLQGHKVA